MKNYKNFKAEMSSVGVPFESLGKNVKELRQ